jgi:RNA polymerase primary sigma factor
MCPTSETTHQDSDPATNPSQDVPCRRRLSREQERELADLIAGGNRAARNRMVQANLGLVFTIARDFLGRGLVLEDLVGEGNLGLIRAAEEFKPSFGTRFSTYATYWIKQAIQHALINTTTTIRVPAHMVQTLTKWRRTEQNLRVRGNHIPDFEEVASDLGLSEGQKYLVRLAHRASRLRPEGSSGDGAPNRFLDETPDRHSPVENKLQADDERENVKRRMEGLDDRERTVLAMRYGLNGKPLTLREVGTRLGLCSEWVRKIESSGISKLGGDHDHRAEASRNGR